MEDVRKFYDEFKSKLLADFINGNKRIVAAIKFVKAQLINAGPRNILDIGCGIGWTTYELGRSFPRASVQGVDLSPALIDTAKKIFRLDNINFDDQDITKHLDNHRSKYDVVVMVDVFEHIPASSRAGFYADIRSVLAENFTIILTCPTKLHQDYLKAYNPAGLQPVDEDVDLPVLIDFADNLEAQIIHFGFVNIWRVNDYLYGVISNHPEYKKIEPGNAALCLNKKVERYRMLKAAGVELPFPFPSLAARAKGLIMRTARKFIGR